MTTLLIKANQLLYASEGVINESLFRVSTEILGEWHEIIVTDTTTCVWDIPPSIPSALTDKRAVDPMKRQPHPIQP